MEGSEAGEEVSGTSAAWLALALELCSCPSTGLAARLCRLAAELTLVPALGRLASAAAQHACTASSLQPGSRLYMVHCMI